MEATLPVLNPTSLSFPFFQSTEIPQTAGEFNTFMKVSKFLPLPFELGTLLDFQSPLAPTATIHLLGCDFLRFIRHTFPYQKGEYVFGN